MSRVEQIMLEMLERERQEHIHDCAQRALATFKAAIQWGIPDEQAIRTVVEAYDMPESTAQLYLAHVKEHPDPEEW